MLSIASLFIIIVLEVIHIFACVAGNFTLGINLVCLIDLIRIQKLKQQSTEISEQLVMTCMQRHVHNTDDDTLMCIYDYDTLMYTY